MIGVFICFYVTKMRKLAKMFSSKSLFEEIYILDIVKKNVYIQKVIE